MIDKLLTFVAPHHCCGCGEVGHPLCVSCINNIIDEPFTQCVACLRPSVRSSGLCHKCRLPYSRAFVGGSHTGTLDMAIDSYKFMMVREMSKSLTAVVDAFLPELPQNAVLVPVPTIATHVRERGFDHTKMLVRDIAAIRKYSYATSLLCRRTQTVQRGASARERNWQAEKAFRVRGKVDDAKIYVLVDDVMTTGATLRYGAETLRQAGAKEVWILVLARQILS